MPALPLDEAGKYVAGAYAVFAGLLVIYVAIMAARLERMKRELSELADIAESNARTSDEVAEDGDQSGQGVSAPPRGSGREAEQPREVF